MQAVTDKRTRHRMTHPLFGLTRYRAAIEAAHETTWARNEAGLAPAGFDAAPRRHGRHPEY